MKSSWGTLLYECLIVIFCLKAGVDVSRVATEDEDDDGEIKGDEGKVVSQRNEMILCRTLEVIGEVSNMNMA